MAIVRMTAQQAWQSGQADRQRIDAGTEDEVRRHMLEDGFDPDAPFNGLLPAVDSAALRNRLGLSHDEFARRLHVPVDVVRKWEAGAQLTDPAVRVLLRLISDNPEHVFAVLAA